MQLLSKMVLDFDRYPEQEKVQPIQSDKSSIYIQIKIIEDAMNKCADQIKGK